MPDIFRDTEARFCWNLLKLNVEGAQERKEDKVYTFFPLQFVCVGCCFYEHWTSQYQKDLEHNRECMH